MLFNTPTFLIGFLPLALAGFFAAGRLGGNRAALGFVACASLVFYGWWDWRFVPLLAGSIAVNFRIGERLRLRGSAQPWLAAGIAANLGLLGWFKYAGFFSRTFFGHPLSTALPLAISFFTFQQIMYLVDTARGERPDAGFLPYAAFIAFFPHLIAGPIVRPREILPQLVSPALTRPRAEAIADGMTVFLLGLAKKAVLADMFAGFADAGFNGAAHGASLTFFEAWYALLAYALQIYFDFSGYSDMAIGLARMMNVRFPINFDSPYRAASIADFWRRWHITLGAFLRDYVYIPLGGSRCGQVRHLGNLLLTMLLCGLWHGAAWRFVLWGGLHGVFLSANVLWRRTGLRMARLPAHLLTLLCVVLAWLPFRADGLRPALVMLRGAVGVNGIALPQLLVGFMPWLGHLATPVASLPSLGEGRTLDFPEVTACLVLGWALVLGAPHLHALGPRARSVAVSASFALVVQAVFFAPHVLPFVYFRF